MFTCFFSKFALPCHSILETIIEKLRNKVVELVQNFMIDEIVTTLATHANEGSSRRSGGGVSEDVKKLVKNAVLLTVSDSSQTLILDEALGVLKRGFKGGHKSLKAQLYESQVKSLQDNLLSKSSAGDRTSDPKNKDRRKQGGKDLNVMYKDIVVHNANSVIGGARDHFVHQVEKMVEKTLKEMKSRLVQGKSSGRSKPKGLPVLLKLRRECFKCIH
jgi:putative lipoic acid-binding regulatory protein